MSLPVEQILHTAPLALTDTVFATLTTVHETCEVLVNPNSQPNAVGSIWSLWEVSASGIEIKIGEGQCALPSKPCRILIDHEVQGGGFFRLKGRAVKGTTGNVTATLTGYSNAGVIAASEEVAASVALSNIETIIGTLAAPHQFCEVLVNTHGDKAARNSIWRLYDVSGTVVAQVTQDGDVANVPSRIFTKVEGAGLFRLTAQSVNGPTAVNSDVAIIGYDPLTPMASAGGITQLTNDVLAGPGAGSVSATVVKATGAAGLFPISCTSASIGAAPATTGALRLENAAAIKGASGIHPDRIIGEVNAGDGVDLGDATTTGAVNVFSGSHVNLDCSGNPGAQAGLKSGTGSMLVGNGRAYIDSACPLVEFALNTVTPTFGHEDSTAAATVGQPTIFKAQDVSGAGSTGGEARLKSGHGPAGDGPACLYCGATERFRAETAGISLFGGAGDYGGGAKVAFWHDGTAPTGPIGGGFGMWSDSKRPAFRFGAGDDVVILDSAALGDVTADSKDLHLVILRNGVRYGIQLYTLP